MAKSLLSSKKIAVRGITRCQNGKMQDILGHGLAKSSVLISAPTTLIDYFIKEIGLSLRDAWVKEMEKRFRDFSGHYRVPVNYEVSGAIAKAIEEAKFDSKFVGLSPGDIPLVGTGQVEHEVYEVNFGKVMYTRDLPNALKERGKKLGFANGFKFADPLTALRYACALPDQQRKYPINILFYDAKGQLWNLCLREYCDGRDLYIGQDDPGKFWDDHNRFLVAY